MNTHKKALGVLFLLSLVLLSVNFISAADISQSWDCNNALGGCITFQACSDQARDDCYNCGLARPIYAFKPESNFRFSNYYFNAPQAGNYTCTVGVTETGYAYYDGAQIEENVDVYLAGNYLGRSTDWKCNSETSCKSCYDGTTYFTKTLTLAVSNNEIKLEAFNSHALRSVAISCDYLPPVCAQTNNGIEACDNIDNNCNGLIDEGLTQTLNQFGVCSGNTQTCTAGNWFNTSGNVNPSNEACNVLDDDCDGQVDEGLSNCNTCTSNCGGSCINGQIRNNFSTNYCSGLNVYTNSSFEICVNNAWQFNSTNIANLSCNGNTILVDQYCSGSNLTQNWSQPICTSGACGRSYFTNQTVCANGCSADQCIVPDQPTCTVDYLANSSGQNIFNISNYYLNRTGSFFILGTANSNSNSFILRNVVYNWTGFSTWNLANPQSFWNIWSSDQHTFNEGNQTVCCEVTSQRCSGGNNCETRTSEANCESFCIDTQAPIVTINSVPNMSNWNSSNFNWSWSVVDTGCAGLNHFNVSFRDSNGSVLDQRNNFNASNLLVSNLTNNHSYTLTVSAVDNAGNSGSATSSLLTINLTLGNNGNNTNNQTNNQTNNTTNSTSGGSSSRSGRDCNNANGQNITLYDSVFVDQSPTISLRVNNTSLSSGFVLNSESKLSGGNYALLLLVLLLVVLILFFLLVRFLMNN